MIRRSEPEDLEEIAETFALSFETLLSFLPDLHTREDRRRFMTEVVPLDHEIWVAEVDGRIVGLAALGETTLGHIYVHPDYLRRGIGSQLLEQTKELRPAGFTLWTFRANEPACRFYERHGLHAVAFGDGSATKRGCRTCSTSGGVKRPHHNERLCRATSWFDLYAAACCCRPRIERAMTRRWISLVPS